MKEQQPTIAVSVTGRGLALFARLMDNIWAAVDFLFPIVTGKWGLTRGVLWISSGVGVST